MEPATPDLARLRQVALQETIALLAGDGTPVERARLPSIAKLLDALQRMDRNPR